MLLLPPQLLNAVTPNRDLAQAKASDPVPPGAEAQMAHGTALGASVSPCHMLFHSQPRVPLLPEQSLLGSCSVYLEALHFHEALQSDCAVRPEHRPLLVFSRFLQPAVLRRPPHCAKASSDRAWQGSHVQGLINPQNNQGWNVKQMSG